MSPTLMRDLAPLVPAILSALAVALIFYVAMGSDLPPHRNGQRCGDSHRPSASAETNPVILSDAESKDLQYPRGAIHRAEPKERHP